MHHITISSLAVFSAICLLYALVVIAILQFCKVAKLKPNPPKFSTLRVELTICAPAPAGGDSDKSKGTRGPIAGLFITHQHDNRLRSLILLGGDAEKVLSFLTHCFNCQLAASTDEFHNEPASLSA